MQELHYGLKQPLRFYEKLEHQNRFKKGGDENNFDLICPTTRILPFQIKRAAGVTPISSIKLTDPTGVLPQVELISYFIVNEIQSFALATVDYLVHFGRLDLSGYTVPEGKFYLEVTDGIDIWYSEVITFKTFDPDTLADCVYTKIEYWDICNVDEILYKTLALGSFQYKNVLYLDVDIGKPEYAYEEEGTIDGEGTFQPDFLRVRKNYLLQSVLPEFMTDAVSIIPLHLSLEGKVEVYTHRGYTGEVETMTVTPNWQGTLGTWSITDINFNTCSIRKTNCCDGNEEELHTDCLREYEDPVAEVLEGSADYLAGEYFNLVQQANVAFVDDEKVIVEDSGTGLKTIYLQNPATGVPDKIQIKIWVAGESVGDLNKIANNNNPNPWHFWADLDKLKQKPFIVNLGPDIPSGKHKVDGFTFGDALCEVMVDAGAGYYVAASGTGYDFINPGILFDLPVGATGVYIRSKTTNCYLGDSLPVTLLPGTPNFILGVGDPSDLPNFDHGACAIDLGAAVLEMNGGIFDDTGTLSGPDTGDTLILTLSECDSGYSKPTPIVPGNIVFDYSVDIDLATAVPTLASDAPTVTWWDTYVKPNITGGTGIYSSGGIAGEFTFRLDKAGYGADTGNIDFDADNICVQGRCVIDGQFTPPATSCFEKAIKGIAAGGIRGVSSLQDGVAQTYNVVLATKLREFTLVSVDEIFFDGTTIFSGSGASTDPIGFAGSTANGMDTFTGTLGNWTCSYANLTLPGGFLAWECRYKITVQDTATGLQYQLTCSNWWGTTSVPSTSARNQIFLLGASQYFPHVAPDDGNIQVYPLANQLTHGFSLFMNPELTDGTTTQTVVPYTNATVLDAIWDLDINNPIIKKFKHSYQLDNSNDSNTYTIFTECMARMLVV